MISARVEKLLTTSAGGTEPMPARGIRKRNPGSFPRHLGFGAAMEAGRDKMTILTSRDFQLPGSGRTVGRQGAGKARHQRRPRGRRNARRPDRPTAPTEAVRPPGNSRARPTDHAGEKAGRPGAAGHPVLTLLATRWILPGVSVPAGVRRPSWDVNRHQSLRQPTSQKAKPTPRTFLKRFWSVGSSSNLHPP